MTLRSAGNPGFFLRMLVVLAVEVGLGFAASLLLPGQVLRVSIALAVCLGVAWFELAPPQGVSWSWFRRKHRRAHPPSPVEMIVRSAPNPATEVKGVVAEVEKKREERLRTLPREARKEMDETQRKIEAWIRMSNGACNRDQIVEAYFWMLKAQLAGFRDAPRAMSAYQSMWLSVGCPGEFENVRVDFTEERGAFTRAVMNLRCGINPANARAEIRMLAQNGLEEADQFQRVLRR